jgi:synaptobrevin family protein YKT6
LHVCLGFTIHAYGRVEGVCGVIVSDKAYDSRVAHSILSKFSDEFLAKYPRTAFANATKQSSPLAFPQLKEYIVKYQDPAQADSITKIQKELDEAMKVIHKTMESVMERGEKIDSLVAKSDGLSAQSKMFYTQVRYFFKFDDHLRGIYANFNMCRRKSRTLAAQSCEYVLTATSFSLGVLSLVT